MKTPLQPQASSTESAPLGIARLARPMIGFGQVRHARLRPVGHAFAYPGYFWLLPLRALAREPVALVRRNRRGWLSFHDADHGDGGSDALAWLDGVLHKAGVWTPDLRDGEVWLQAYPRVLGYVFKPVSFWYVHGADGRLAAVVAEVNNTFGERHCYVLHGPDLGWGREMGADKVLHVSPFCEAKGQYRFRFMRTGLWGRGAQATQDARPETDAARPERLVVRVDHDDEHGPLIQTALSGVLEPLSLGNVMRAVWGWPLMTFGVVARIHWQALRLWLKRVPFHRKPEPPLQPVTRAIRRSTP